MWQWCLREIIVGGGLALLIGGGYLHGRFVGRWQPLPAAAPVDLASIPRDLPTWTCAADFEPNAADLESAEIDHYLARSYELPDSAESLNMLIVSGPGGPISVHPPEVCFAGRGYQMESLITSVKIPGQTEGRDHQFSMAIFRGPASTDGHRVQLFWAWSDSGIWSTPGNPRLAFARLPRLYKIYVSRSLRPDQGRQNVDESVQFLQEFLPHFERLMSTAASETDVSSHPGRTSQGTGRQTAWSLSALQSQFTIENRRDDSWTSARGTPPAWGRIPQSAINGVNRI